MFTFYSETESFRCIQGNNLIQREEKEFLISIGERIIASLQPDSPILVRDKDRFYTHTLIGRFARFTRFYRGDKKTFATKLRDISYVYNSEDISRGNFQRTFPNKALLLTPGVS